MSERAAYRGLLALGLVAAVVLDLNMKVQTTFTPIELPALRVRALKAQFIEEAYDEVTFDLCCGTAHVLLAAVALFLSGGARPLGRVGGRVLLVRGFVTVL